MGSEGIKRPVCQLWTNDLSPRNKHTLSSIRVPSYTSTSNSNGFIQKK